MPHNATMRAVICTKYGPPEVLQIRDVAKPIPKDDEILVKIYCSAVNSGDVKVRGLAVKGFMKLMMRLVVGFSRPRKQILGTVYSGIIERIGSNVRKYNVGDKVFGMTGFRFGTYAEYISINEKSIVATMPKNSSFDEAVSIIFGSQTALYFLDKLKIKERENSKILIIGSSGSVGVSAVQIAKHYGADVTAVCGSGNRQLMIDLGLSKVICYDEEDFTSTPEKFDIVFDAVGKTTKRQCANLINTGGVFKTVGGMEYASEKQEQLELIKELFECGGLKAVIDKTFSMENVVDSHRYVDTGRKKGNVILKIGNDF